MPVFRSGKIAMDRFLRDNLSKSGTGAYTRAFELRRKTDSDARKEL